MTRRSHIIRDVEDEVFRALADPSRRLLLDRLYGRDGQTLGELEEQLPAMTRFGVMKHLRILETAGMITTRRSGRVKLHFLNPVPIRMIYERWVSKFAEPWMLGLSDLKKGLENDKRTKARVPGRNRGSAGEGLGSDR